MKALIFAAGRGERMRPLTDTTPKPLLNVGGKALIIWQLEKLAAAGVRDVVINTSHLADQFAQVLGDGAAWGLQIHYAYEGKNPLETGGGMLHALAWLGDAPFLAINGDIFTDFDYTALPAAPAGLAHLVLVDNPPQHPQGDFLLNADGQIDVLPHAAPQQPTLSRPWAAPTNALTFAGIGLYRPELLLDWRKVIGTTTAAADDTPRFKLAPLLFAAADHQRLSGQFYRGTWTDVGTPERLAAIENKLRR